MTESITTTELNDLLKFQQYFDTDLERLANQKENEIEFFGQTHFGDLKIEESENENERYNLYRSLDENIKQGEAMIQIEYSGKYNNYSYETVLEFNKPY
jgi:hypothetical protein